MKCSVCGHEIKKDQESWKIRGGNICSDCLADFSPGVQSSINHFSSGQLHYLKTHLYKENVKPWLRLGNMTLADCAVILNGFQYSLAQMRAIRLNFHPKDFGRERGTASGIITLCIWMEKPHLFVEEPVFDGNRTIRYHITGENITYIFPAEMEEIMREIRNSIDSGIFNLYEYHEERRQKAEREKIRRAQKAGSESAGRERGQQKKQGGKTANTSRPVPGSRLEEAMLQFSLTAPFTKEQVRRARNRILTIERAHPDDGGTEERFEELNESYQMLLKFASD